MTKQPINVRIPNFTRTQIDRIAAAEEMTPGEVVALAVDRLYQREYKEQLCGIDGAFGALVDQKENNEKGISEL